MHKIILSSFICLSLFCSSANAQIHSYVENIYNLAKTQNIRALQQIKSYYGTIDYTDEKGITALCLAVYRNDYNVFKILSKLGANRQHQCIKQIPHEYRIAFNQRYKSSLTRPRTPSNPYRVKQDLKLSPTALAIGGIAGIGGIVALASGGGGSSKSTSNNSTPPSTDDDFIIITPDDNNNNNNNDNTNNNTNNDSDNNTNNNTDNNGSDSTYKLSAKDFETTEYKKGNFLSQINAASAYAKAYTAKKSNNGSIILSDENITPIKVGIIDVGVYNHRDLPTIQKGYNFAYGPCRSSSQKNCWFYAESDSWFGSESGFAFRDANGNESDIIWEGTESEFNSYASQFPSNYTWNGNEYLYEPVADSYSINHGTHVAGIISAKKNNSGMHGVAPNAQIIPIRYDFLIGLEKPIITAVDAGAKIINASLGTASEPGFNAAISKNDWQYYMSTDLAGYKYLADKKSTLFVLAAGNESQNEPSMESAAGLHVNGLKDVMLVVAATKTTDPTKLASYSNKCGSAYKYCLVAPGGDTDGNTGVISTIGKNNEITGYAGTSMATPVVSGAAAFLWGVYPNLSASDVASILLETATDLGDEKTFGQGLLNLGAAVNQPLGKTTLATSNSVSGGRQDVSNTKLRIPSAFRHQLLKQLPQSISMLDKYDRSFDIPMNAFVKNALHNPDTFKNKLHRFRSFNEKQKVQTTPTMSFGFTKTSLPNSEIGIGEMDVSFKLDSHDLKFYFKEDTQILSNKKDEPSVINPFTKMSNAYGIEDTFKINNNLKLKTGFVTGTNALYETDEDKDDVFEKHAFAFETMLEYEPIKGIAVGFSAGILNENNSILGLNGSGGFDINNGRTYYSGISASIEPLPDFRITGAYFLGMTEEEKHSAFLRTSKLYSDGFSLDAQYNLNETDYVGLMLTSPLRVNKGTAIFDVPTGRDYYSDVVNREIYKASLKTEAREYDWAMYYHKQINDNMKFKLQTGIRINPDHQKDADSDYQMLMGFDWKFN